MPLDLHAIADRLATIASPPRERNERYNGDVDGAFDRWFDGGAIKIVTGWNEYHFADGTLAIVATSSMLLHIEMRLPNGSYLTVAEQRKAPAFFPASAV